MKFSRFLSGALVGLTLMSSTQLTLAVQPAAKDFSDVAATRADYTAIMFLKDKGIISGYPDGTFKPDQVVNRAESLKMILGINYLKYWDRATDAISGGADTYSDNQFKDVTDKTAWYYDYVKTAYSDGLIKGYEDGTFKPDQQVNLVENLKILLEHTFLKIDSLAKIKVTAKPYNDVAVDAWYAQYVQYAKDHNLLTADAKNNIYPATGMTRGKLAQAIYAVYQEDEVLYNSPTNVSVTLDATLNKFVVKQAGKKIAELPGTFTANDEVAATMNKITDKNAYVSVCATGMGGYIWYTFCLGNSYQVDLTTGTVKDLDTRTDKAVHLDFMDISPDEQTTAWTSDYTGHKIYLLSTTDNKVVKTFDVDPKYGQFGDVKFSPDGAKLAYAAIVGDPSAEYSAIFTIDIATGKQTSLKEGLGIGPFNVTGWTNNTTPEANDPLGDAVTF